MFRQKQLTTGTAAECNRLYGENMDLKEQVQAVNVCRVNKIEADATIVRLHVEMLQSELGAVMVFCNQRLEWVIPQRAVMASQRLSEFFKPFV